MNREPVVVVEVRLPPGVAVCAVGIENVLALWESHGYSIVRRQAHETGGGTLTQWLAVPGAPEVPY